MAKGTYIIQTMLKIAKYVITGFGKLEEFFLCALLFSMVLLACLQIFLRDVFSGGLLWADPLLRYMVLWVGMFGAAVATKKGRHIAIDLVSYLLPASVKPWLFVATNFISAIVAGVLTYASIIFIGNEATFGGRGLLSVSSWIWNLVFPIAFTLMTMRFLASSVTNIIEIAKGPQQ